MVLNQQDASLLGVVRLGACPPVTVQPAMTSTDEPGSGNG